MIAVAIGIQNINNNNKIIPILVMLLILTKKYNQYFLQYNL